MKSGIVKWYNPDKGFGFISTVDDGDVFVHHTDIKVQDGKRIIEDGEEVMLEVVNSKKGPQAINVTRIP